MISNYIFFIFCPLFCIIFHCSIILSIKLLFKILNYISFLFITLILFLSHIIHNMLYALYYQYLVNTDKNIDIIINETNVTFIDFIYFSFSTYTTLGIGDIFITGDARLVAAIESLLGLILIAWSATVTYYYLTYNTHSKR
jgi:hypothetical protein